MEQTLEIRLPIYLLIGTTTILGTFLFMNWTANGGLAPLVKLFYDQNQITTFTQELKIVINTAYYFSLFVIFCYAVGEVKRLISKKEDQPNAPEPNFTKTTKQSLVVGFHIFFIFEAFFYYLLNNDGDDLSKRYINLLPFWFLTSWSVYMVGSWISNWAKLKLNVSGIIMVSLLWILILGEIYHNGFIHKALNL